MLLSFLSYIEKISCMEADLKVVDESWTAANAPELRF